MDVREAAAGQVGGDDASTTRMGAVALPIGVVLIAISEIFHPSREDPMDFPAVFREYAHSDLWTSVHLGEYFGFLLLLGGLVALYYSVSARPGAVMAAFMWRNGSRRRIARLGSTPTGPAQRPPAHADRAN